MLKYARQPKMCIQYTSCICITNIALMVIFEEDVIFIIIIEVTLFGQDNI